MWYDRLIFRPATDMEARYLSGSVAWGTATANILVAMGAACCVILIGIIAWVWWDSRFEKTEKDEESCQVEELQETQSYESGERKDDIEDRVEVMSTADWSYSVVCWSALL